MKKIFDISRVIFASTLQMRRLELKAWNYWLFLNFLNKYEIGKDFNQTKKCVSREYCEVQNRTAKRI